MGVSRRRHTLQLEVNRVIDAFARPLLLGNQGGGSVSCRIRLDSDVLAVYAELTAEFLLSVAISEHDHTQWGFRELVERRCCHNLQLAIAWVGGVTVAKKIAAIASGSGPYVTSHGGPFHLGSLHFIFSRVDSRLAEWVVIGNQGEPDLIRPLYPYLDGAPMSVDGHISAIDAPGIGTTTIDEWLLRQLLVIFLWQTLCLTLQCQNRKVAPAGRNRG